MSTTATRDVRDPSGIDPKKPYPFKLAVQFIPSPRGGFITTMTLRRWMDDGMFKPVYRVVGGQKQLTDRANV